MDTKKRLITLIGVIIVAVLFLLPTVSRESFGTGWISKPLSLGLDLSGGVYLVYEVQSEEAVKSRLTMISTRLKSELTERKIAVLRPKVNNARQIEVPLITEASVEKAKAAIQDEFRDLTFIGKGDDAGRVTLLYGFTDAQAEKIERDAISQAVETLRNRVDQFGVAEPLIQKAGVNRIILQMPGVSDIEAVKRIVGSVAKLEFRLVPTGAPSDQHLKIKDKAGNIRYVEDPPLLTGDAVDSARVDPEPGKVVVTLSLTSDGGKTFYKITSENVRRQLAIVLDGVLYSDPVIDEPIGGGTAIISGGFTLEEARELAVVLRAGALPAPLKVLEERTVGPSLGLESIQKGAIAILVGFSMIVVFMAVYYGKSGLIAVFSLALNLILLLALLSAFGATLTLPGLAGLALTVGMAVDSNVIIFERIRDELRIGATRDAAVNAGFEKALSAIIDSNLTTLLAGSLLYYFGTGPIRGFAVSLSVGIITTVFCATFAARLMFDLFELKGRNKAISI